MAAAYCAELPCAALHGADRERCLFPNRPGDADRPGRQERDPDRRVCEGRIRERASIGGSGGGRGTAAPAAYFDDLVRVHSGMRSVVGCERCRRSGAADYGHHGDRRYADGDRDWHLPGPGDLLFGRENLGSARTRAASSAPTLTWRLKMRRPTVLIP